MRGPNAAPRLRVGKGGAEKKIVHLKKREFQRTKILATRTVVIGTWVGQERAQRK